MALINCAECGQQISDKATACPHCGAPPDIYSEVLGMPNETVGASVHAGWIHAATHVDGRELLYSEDSRLFDLGGAELEPQGVASLDKKVQLNWTRYDVRTRMHKAARKGLPMEPLPAEGERSFVERTSAFMDKTSSAMTGFAESLEPANPSMVCPHCQSRGTVRTKKVKRKRGISGGKATAALFTGGVSLLATGLSRKENVTEARCRKCGNVWYF